MKNFLRQTSYYFIIFIGLLQVFGFVIRNPHIEIMGRLTAASPMPIVFGQIDGLEYWASSYKLELIFKDGTSMTKSITPIDFAHMRGNHWVHMAYVIPLACAPISSDEFGTSTFRYGLCKGGPLAQDWEIPAELKEGYITITNNTVGEKKQWIKHFICNK